MNLMTETLRSGTRTLASFAAIVTVALTAPAMAETVRTVNGTSIDSSVLDFYIESRTQRPPSQVSAEERSAMLDELTDIYLLATQDAAAEVRKDERVQAQIELQAQSLIAQSVAGQYVEGLSITDEDIQAEYDRQAAIAPPLQYKARHILVESQGEASAIIGELDGGADFESLARERSTGPSGPNGGDLGWFSPNQMVAPFSNAVQSLDNGAYTSEPVQTDFGWHVILREDTRESEAPPLESVRDTIRQSIQQQRFQAYLENIRENASQ